MAEISTGSAAGVKELIQEEENYQLGSSEKSKPSGRYSVDASSDEKSEGGKPDLLAHLPEHFRKEIEAQSVVNSRRVSFKVRGYFLLKLMIGIISICGSE